MFDFFSNLFSSEYMPHGGCYYWQPGVLWSNVIGDALTTLAYFIIPFFLIYFVRKRKDIEFRSIFGMFGLFIFFCGLTHLLAVWTVWDPIYRFTGVVKVATGLVSMATALMLIPLIPQALVLPSPKQLEEKNEELKREIVNRKKIEEDLKQQQQTLKQQQQLLLEQRNQLKRANENLKSSNAYLKRFSFATSHDLKEPLRGIVSFSQLLRKRYGQELPQEANETIGYIKDEGNRLLHIINSLMQLSTIKEWHKNVTDIDLNETLKKATENLGEEILAKGAKVEIDELPVIRGDCTQLQQLFENLLSNSLKFQREGVAPDIHVSCKDQGSSLEFEVKDNGIGINMKYTDKIFHIFETLNQRQLYPGAGIGLSICKNIVKNHGGEIRADSEEGKGTSVIFTLPKE